MHGPQLALQTPTLLLLLHPRVWLSPALPRGSIKRGRRYPSSSDGRTGRPSALTVVRSTRRAQRQAQGETGGKNRLFPPPTPFPF